MDWMIAIAMEKTVSVCVLTVCCSINGVGVVNF